MVYEVGSTPFVKANYYHNICIKLNNFVIVIANVDYNYSTC